MVIPIFRQKKRNLKTFVSEFLVCSLVQMASVIFVMNLVPKFNQV